MSNSIETPNATPEDADHEQLEHGFQDGGYYGIAPGIAGVLMGALIIWFMFAVADGFA
jgi:hypothetical protein